jgi:hypothetical protein
MKWRLGRITQSIDRTKDMFIEKIKKLINPQPN